MKKQIISLLTLMMACASASYAQSESLTIDVESDSEDVFLKTEESVESKASASKDAVVVTKIDTVVDPALDTLIGLLNPGLFQDSVSADTTDPYVPFSEGLFCRPEVGGGLMVASSRVDTKSNFNASVGVNMGYQLNANLSLGFGLSFYYSSMTMENFDELMAWNPSLRDEYVDKVYRLPVYVMGRWKFMSRKLTPFIDGRFGYAVGLSEYKLQKDMYDPGIRTDNGGLFLELEAGIQYKNFSVALVLNRFACKDADPDYRKMKGWENIKNSYNDSYIGLKFGFDFTFGNGEEEESEETEDSASSSKQ